MNDKAKKSVEWITKTQRLDSRLLEKFLPTDKSSPRPKPDPTPDARITNPCESNKDLVMILDAIIRKREYLLNSNRFLWYIIEIQLISGARISEVLEIMPRDIMPSGHILIRGMKGSSNKIVYVSDARKYMLQCRNDKFPPFLDYNRFYVYREYKKLGIGSYFSNNSLMSVTHFFRHLNAQLQQDEGVTIEDIQSFLAHKSQNSTHYYVREKGR